MAKIISVNNTELRQARMFGCKLNASHVGALLRLGRVSKFSAAAKAEIRRYAVMTGVYAAGSGYNDAMLNEAIDYSLV